MNFTSENPLKYAKKVNDLHKGWTLAGIARCAITRAISSFEENLNDSLTSADFMKYVIALY